MLAVNGCATWTYTGSLQSSDILPDAETTRTASPCVSPACHPTSSALMAICCAVSTCAIMSPYVMTPAFTDTSHISAYACAVPSVVEYAQDATTLPSSVIVPGDSESTGTLGADDRSIVIASDHGPNVSFSPTLLMSRTLIYQVFPVSSPDIFHWAAWM